MIDRLELRVPHSAPFSREFDTIYRQLRNDPKGPFRPSLHYLAVADLRPLGFPVMLHTFNVHDKHGNHKLELFETGAKLYSQMACEIERVFAVYPGELAVTRVDMAADVEGVPVNWFLRNIRAKFKRFTSSLGELEAVPVAEMGRKGVETIYLGKRPNFYRIYDKVAERKSQHLKMIAKAKREHAVSLLPTFEQIYGHADTGFTLTRVERQIGAGRVPSLLATFRLLRNAPNFNPFDMLVPVGVGLPEPSPDDYDFSQYASGMYLRHLVEEQGAHRARQIVNRYSRRNASRIFQKYAAFLPSDDVLISPQDLYDRYRESSCKQLAA